MDIKKLKGSVQLAQLRYKSDPSEANKTILDNAVLAYEAAQKTETQKIDQVSGKKPSAPKKPVAAKAAKPANEPKGDDLPSTTAESDDETGEEDNLPEDTADNGESTEQTDSEEKKTDEQA